MKICCLKQLTDLCATNPREESVDLELTHDYVSKLLLEVAINLELNLIVKL